MSFDIVTLLQVRHGEARLVSVQYVSGTATIKRPSKNYVFKVSTDFHVFVGQLLIDVQPHGACAVIRVTQCDDVVAEPNIMYRWITVHDLASTDADDAYGQTMDNAKKDQKINASLAMGDAMRQAQESADRAGLSFGQRTCIDHAEDNSDAQE